MPCYNGECISKERLCDGHFDCQDKSDEPLGCKEVNTVVIIYKISFLPGYFYNIFTHWIKI